MPRTILVFIGPPGSGKGTQSDILSELTDLPAISTGELLRHEQKIGSSLGRKVRGLMSNGKLVSATLIDHLLKLRLSKSDTKRGFMIDGYPRNEYQFRNLLKMIKGDDRLYFIEFQVPDREVVTRLSGRRICDCGASYHIMYNPPRVAGKCDLCGHSLRQRTDDRPGVIRTRLKEYHNSIRPLLQKASGRGSIIVVDGERSIPTISKELKEQLKTFGVLKKKTQKK
ncbi:MAG TPA: nucleoside monophosphate kinase [bacterium]|nr:nucleoside monophosphate kinase [bacterium]